MRILVGFWILWLVACHEPAKVAQPQPVPVPPTAPVVATVPPPEPAQNLELDSADILARSETADVLVRHILIGWNELEPNYHGHMDPRAAQRTQAQAARLIETVAAQLRADPASLPQLIATYSEDPGGGGEPYAVTATTSFVPEFKNLALRLKPDEVGIVRTTYGYHIIVRVPPPAADPLESAEILARPAGPGPVRVQHILIGWDLPTTRDPRGKARTKAAADELARQVLVTVRAGGNMVALMKEYSEDPGSAAAGTSYEVNPGSHMVQPFKDLALRLAINEAGLVKTQFGWHVMKRVPPPPPDSLESVAILKRAPVTETAKVKHILLGWTGAHADDTRGSTRDRRELERLVKSLVGKLAKGEMFEPLMDQFSEDPGSAKAGTSYDVTPDASLVEPFKRLSLRLKLNEVGVVKSDFGIHIIKRVE